MDRITFYLIYLFFTLFVLYLQWNKEVNDNDF